MLQKKLTRFHKMFFDTSDKKNLWLVIIIFALLFYAGSVPEPTPSFEEVDTSFLTDEPCAAPCWHGIRLNESTEEDAYEILNQLPFVQSGSVVERTGGWKDDDQAIIFAYDCLYASRYCGDVLISENRVQRIWFSVGFDLTFENAVQKLGTPDYIRFIRGSGERVSCSRHLYWKDKNILIENFSKNACPTLNEIRDGIRVERNTRVDTIFYVTMQGPWPLIEEGGGYIEWDGFSD